jgi:hypothetical protein
LELEAEDKIMHVYHVDIIMEEEDSMEERTKLPTEETAAMGRTELQKRKVAEWMKRQYTC